MAEDVRAPPIKFHINHGANVVLADNNSVAYRKSSFANAVALSDRPLFPNEVFLVEIEKTEPGWTGHLRLGLTQIDPSKQNDSTMPSYTLPDFTDYGNSWICAITRSHNKISENCQPGCQGVNGSVARSWSGSDVIEELEKKCLVSRVNLMPLMRYSPYHSTSKKNILPTDEGSRIGVVFIPKGDSDLAEMHYIINGEDQGPFTKKLPYKEAPLFAVVDVYGTTKQVRIIETFADALSLKNLCRSLIRSRIDSDSIGRLPLPCLLQNYLKNEM